MENIKELEAIIDYKIALEKAKNDLRHTVAVARLAGASWSDVGAQLGISKQAAQQQYADAKPNTYRCNCGWAHVVPVDTDGCKTATDEILAHIRAEHPEVGK